MENPRILKSHIVNLRFLEDITRNKSIMFQGIKQHAVLSIIGISTEARVEYLIPQVKEVSMRCQYFSLGTTAKICTIWEISYLSSTEMFFELLVISGFPKYILLWTNGMGLLILSSVRCSGKDQYWVVEKQWAEKPKYINLEYIRQHPLVLYFSCKIDRSVLMIGQIRR